MQNILETATSAALSLNLDLSVVRYRAAEKTLEVNLRGGSANPEDVAWSLAGRVPAHVEVWGPDGLLALGLCTLCAL